MSQEEPNRSVNGWNLDEELPPELKAIEAQLASLRPRDDRLDRERLVFLAGQATAAGRGVPARSIVRAWGWPAAFAAMTAVAAALAVALVLRPPPEVVERIRVVQVPVEPAASRSGQPAHDASGDAAPSSGVRPPATAPFPAARAAASRTVSLPSAPDWQRFGSRAEYLAMIDRMLARGVDPWRQPLAVSERGAERARPALSYRQWLETLLDTPAPRGGES